MKAKIITGVVLASLATTGALVYADASTGSGATGISQIFGQRPEGRPGFGERGKRGPHIELTDAEKTSLATMSDAEKKAFFETKMAAEKAKMEAEKTKKDAQEAVIDKLINGESLSDAEKVTLEEIKTERAAQKAEKAKIEAKMAEAKPLLEKLRNGQTLTDDEQAKLDSLKLPPPTGRGPGFGRGPKGLE